jgi:hypothetical protein
MDVLNRSALVVRPRQPLWTGYTPLIPQAWISRCPISFGSRRSTASRNVTRAMSKTSSHNSRRTSSTSRSNRRAGTRTRRRGPETEVSLSSPSGSITGISPCWSILTMNLCD